LSEGINCSVTQKQSEQKDPVLTVQVSLPKHCTCHWSGKGMLIWFSFGHLNQWLVVGMVKHFIPCLVFTHSLPGWRHN